MSRDAVVIGAGPNGLVAANVLADAGWDVLVLEEQQEPGGAVRSDREVHPDYVHDTFSAFYPLAAVSPAITALGLEGHGLEWRHAPAVLGHPLPDRGWALLHRDREQTAAGLEEHAPGDGRAWLDLCAEWDRVGAPLVSSLLSPFPPVRSGARLLAALAGPGGPALVRGLLAPAMELARQRFRSEAARLLVAGNAGHADIPPESPGSGLMGLLLAMTGQATGFPVPRGGAGGLTDALVRRLRERGGELRTGTRVEQVVVRHGRAVGVRDAGGTTHAARHAVVADVLASTLYGSLVDPQHLPPRVRAGMRAFTLDPGTLKVDWALTGPVPWTQWPSAAPGTVHVADSMAEMALSLAHVHAGVVPASPYLLAGQMTSADPDRSPPGTESCWAYTHVPQRVVADAGGEGLTGAWDPSERELLADRVQARMERLAPGFGARVAARRVLGPRELEARDANLVGGAINGGTAQLHQQLVLRPVPGLGRPETPVPGLFLGSASAHPGGSVHGACGRNAARAALLHARIGRLVPGAGRGRVRRG
jgi:phytoene dehydrogenase-like protein